ncbi:MerR family DNA-binding protein [Paenibacillus sp. P26]|nr:MerR family DNA-binding protein [Paenibacillus sp. P26]UUZ95094.1 MerR family DNA-binding protein [Paenibacillus sp. P25]
MIRFIHGLKQSGMKLEDIAGFTGDGCLLTNPDMPEYDVSQTPLKRIEILDRHIGDLKEQMDRIRAYRDGNTSR